MNLTQAQNELMDEALGISPTPPLSAPADGYAGPLSRAHIYEAAKWLAHCVDLMKNQQNQMATCGLKKIAAKYGEDVLRVEMLLEVFKAASA